MPVSPPSPTPWAAARRLSWLLLATGVLAQVLYPLTPDSALTALSVVTVLLLAGAGVVHCAGTLGRPAAARLAAVTAGGSLLAESVGVATGLPFGSYAYTGTLGPALLGVPLLVPLAWVMMAWPCLVAARLLAAPGLRRVLVGAGALAAWDLFLDPQMVAAGHWAWLDATVVVPGSPGIPVSNTVGWLVVGALLVAALDRLLPAGPQAVGVPLTLLGWTWVGSTLASAAFFGRPVTALLGGVALGVVALPALLTQRRTRPGGGLDAGCVSPARQLLRG